MANNFEWKTEDDFGEGWQPENEVLSPPPRKKWGRWGWGLTAVFLLTMLAGIITYSQLNKNVAAVTNDLTQDVIDVHQLVLETAVSRDTDLFQTLLSNPTSDWGSNQIQLVARNLYLNRAPLSIWSNTNQIATQTLGIDNVTTHFSPDLQQVEVQVEQPFLTRKVGGDVEPIVLLNTAVYQKQGPSWLLTPPDNDFWGDKQRVENSILTLHFPARDEQIAVKLAVDLNNLLVEACEAELFRCPKNLALDLYLQTDEFRLLTLNREYKLNNRYSSQFGRRYRLALPTPTLVGVPIDEPGYQALYRGYAAQLLAAVVINLNLDDTNGFRPDYSLLYDSLALFDLSVPKPVGFHILDTAVSPPIPLPDQNIALYCPGSGSPLQQYNLQTEQWQAIELTAGQVYNVARMPNGDGLLFVKDFAGGAQLNWWRSGEELLLLESETAIFVGGAYTLTEKIEQPQYAINVQFRETGGFEWMKLDAALCVAGVCELEPLDSLSMDSPNGRFRLIQSMDSEGWARQIYLEDVETGLRTDFGLGIGAGWMDDDTFALIRIDSTAVRVTPTESTWVIVEVAPSQNNILEINVDDISDALNESYVSDAAQGPFSLDDFLIGSFLPGPDDHWLLLLFDNERSQFSLAYLVEYDPETGQMRLFEDLREFETAVFLGNSPDNDYISVAILDLSGGSMRLYDARQNGYQTYSMPSVFQGSFDWTADSEWLLLLEEEGVRLAAPDHDFERPIVHDFGRCETAVWVNTP